YSSFDKPTKISKGGHTTRFAYSPSRSRYLRTDESEQGATTLTRYLGNVERITHPGGRLEIKRRLPGGALVSYTRSADGQPAGKTTHYLHRDHLGSIDTISNDLGQLVGQMSFDAWGQRRNALDWEALVEQALRDFDPDITGITQRGFTGHEMLDEVGLIHMNGRIYDPRLGRFLQADPLIDGVTDTQGYNRYSYVHNNPLNATDPSGFSAWTRFRGNILKPVIQGIVTAYCVPCGAALAAATTVYYGGDAFDIAIAAFSTYVMASLGQDFAAGGFSGGEAFVFGVTGGITTVLRGGKFGHGFVSAYAGAVTPGYVQGIENSGVRLLASSVIAGSMSEATGGKFANGAATAAFTWALSQTARAMQPGAIGDVEDYFDHYTEEDRPGGPLRESEFTGEVREALEGVLKSPVGKDVARHVETTGSKIKVALSADLESSFQVIESVIFYTTDVQGWLAIDPPGIPHTLGSLMAHEVGHIVGPVHGMSVRQEEVFVTRNYENVYRKFRGMPLRCSYYEPGDVC
ncbi:RHS repeat-associated core domain-containing protein, partial [Marinimicrobium sp. ARAG 43.8]|uniref:RHS repeat domain-containing protein n=1 Tax=Marinimicrobium sp. ARAG 43.8 TaxID=3418719 RepID=UPI003CEF7AE9